MKRYIKKLFDFFLRNIINEPNITTVKNKDIDKLLKNFENKTTIELLSAIKDKLEKLERMQINNNNTLKEVANTLFLILEEYQKYSFSEEGFLTEEEDLLDVDIKKNNGSNKPN